MEYWVLFIFGTIILFVSYFVNHKDIISPSFLLCCGYDLSFFIALLNKDSWEEEISFYTVVVFLSGILAYTIIDTLANRGLFKTIRSDGTANLIPIRINKFVWFICCLVSSVVVAFTIKEVFRIGMLNNNGEGYNIIQNYKVNFFDEDLVENGFNPILTQLLKIPKGLAYIGVLVFSNNFFAVQERGKKPSIAKLSFYLIPGVLYCVERAIMGERYTIIGFILASALAFYFFLQTSNNWNKRLRLRNVVLLTIGLVLVFVLFYNVRTLVGRSNDYSFTEYIGFYVGAEVPMLNKYIVAGDFSGTSNILGGIYSILNRIGFNIEKNGGVWEFRYSHSGMMLGNAYSALRAYYHDLGLLGVVVMNAVYALVFRGTYNFLKKRFYTHKKPYLLFLLYIYYIWIIPFQFFTDYGITKLNAGTITEIIVMLVLFAVITRVGVSNHCVNQLAYKKNKALVPNKTEMINVKRD